MGVISKFGDIQTKGDSIGDSMDWGYPGTFLTRAVLGLSMCDSPNQSFSRVKNLTSNFLLGL